MNLTAEESLLTKIKTLSPQQVAEVEDFVEFLAAKSKKRAALDRLLAVAPALAAAGAEPSSEEDVVAEVHAARVKSAVTIQWPTLNQGQPVRILLDTNIVVSALLWQGVPHHLLAAIQRQPACSSSAAARCWKNWPKSWCQAIPMMIK